MKNIYIVIQTKSRTECKYRAFVIKRDRWDNICDLYADYSTSKEEVITANILPKAMAYQTAERWNEDYRIQGRLMNWEPSK